MDKKTERAFEALFAGIIMICGLLLLLAGLWDLTNDFWEVGEISAVIIIITSLSMIGLVAVYMRRKGAGK